ncbi:MAG: D-aminoacylase [Gemmatimonadota bacterium]
MRATPFVVSLMLVLGACSTGGPTLRTPPPPTADLPDPTGPGPFDVVIQGGRVVDGTGNAWFYADVGIRDDRIEVVAPPGMLQGYDAETRIDAEGMVVAPGFIDIQSHSRGSFLPGGDGRVVSKVTMGVTTEIMGEGTTNAPSSPDMLEDAGRAAGHTQFATFDEWMTAMEQHGAGVNFGSFVGASTVRVIGMERRMGEARGGEIKAMQAAVRQSMEDGAFGIASALIYPPGNFATTDELVAINEAAAPYGGVYITHLRSEADRLLEAIDEAIEIGTRAGLPVEIYHLKAAGRRNWDKAAAAVQKIDSARAAGVDVQANMYPYTAGSTGLAACFPPWASADGLLFENLSSEEPRARIKREVEADAGDWENLCTLSTAEGTMLLGLTRPENRRFVGRYLSDVAAELERDWIDAAMDLVLAERADIGTIFFMMSEDNVAMQMRAPWMKFGTDAGGRDPVDATAPVHPRAYGTFARILGRYVRNEGVITLEDAVRKMTSAVATRLGIRERGLLAPGYFADVVVFDPETVVDHATYEDPHRISTGIEHVFVNGVAVVRDRGVTGALPGRAVRGPGWRGHWP